MSATAILFLLFALFLLLHVPIGFALSMSALSTIIIKDMLPLSFAIQTYFSSSSSFPLLAVPFFILAGDLMLQGGMSVKLVNLGRALFGHKPGALGTITVFTCAIFAALSGSGPATVAAIGGIMIPAMIEEGYDAPFAATLTATSGCLGPIIPPSIIFAMYGVACGVSISDLFMAGFIPGVFMAIGLILFSRTVCLKHKFGVQAVKKTAAERKAAFKDAIWALIAPVIILGGIYGGICTPTESAVIACTYALIVGMFVYKTIKVRDLLRIFSGSALTAGTCLILLGGANVFGRILTLEQVPTMLANLLGSISDSPIVILLLINILLFITGMFMETLAAVVILAPLLLSIVVPLGVSPLHFGVILTMNLTIGLCTPPVGVNLFIAARKANIGLERMIKWLLPSVGILVVILMIFTYCPALVNFLPNLMHSLR